MPTKCFTRQSGKLVKPVAESQVAGLQTMGSGSVVHKAIGQCPEVTVLLGGQEICCLVDTGAQVSTVTESFFKQHFAGERDLVDVSTCIRITGSYGLDIPYLGYIELCLSVAGKEFLNLGFLVVRDPIDSATRRRKMKVPGVIGCNVLRDLREAVEYKSVKDDPVLGPILALYGEARVQSSACSAGRVRIASKKPLLIPARSLRVVEATVQPASTEEVYWGVVQELACYSCPKGFALAPAVVKVTNTGRIPVQVANFSQDDFYISPRATIGTIEIGDLEPDVKVSDIKDGTVFIEEVSVKQPLGFSVDDLIENLDIGSGLTEEEHGQLRSALQEYCNTFSNSDDDLGFCTKIQHRIRTTDDIPVKVPHRRILPNQWPEVRDYLEKSLKLGIIQKSCSPYASAVVLVHKK